ncbi:MAG: Fic family protein [Acidobacteriota bacterium]
MLPILDESYRPSSHWVQDLAQKYDALHQFEPIASTPASRIQEHLYVEQVTENLLLGDLKITRERVRELINGISLPANNQAEQAALSFANAVRYLHTLIANQENKVSFNLTSDLLCELHTLAMEELGEGGGCFRTSEAKPLAEGHQPADAEALSLLIDNALEWFSVPSFQELHPVEQAWLVHLRLMDLQPFAQANGRLVRLATSLYTLRAGLLPIIVSANDREFYHFALVNSFQMITQPGIELFARSLMHTYDEVLKFVKTTDN